MIVICKHSNFSILKLYVIKQTAVWIIQLERNLKCTCVNWIKQYVSEKFGEYIKLVSFQVIPPFDYPCVSSAAMGRITWSNSIKPKGLYWTFEHVPTRIYTFRLHPDTYTTGKKNISFIRMKCIALMTFFFYKSCVF